jgi:hypothetical protein
MGLHGRRPIGRTSLSQVVLFKTRPGSDSRKLIMTMQNFKSRTCHEKVINNMSWKTLVCLQKELKYDITHFFKKCHNNLEYNVSQGT